MPKNIFLQVRCWNLTKNRHSVMSARAVGIFISMLLRYVFVQESNDICAIFMLNETANMNKKPRNIFKFTLLLKMSYVIPQGFKFTNLCQQLRDKSIKIGYLPFSFAILLSILKAANLSQGQVNTADQFNRLTNTDKIKAGIAHKMLKLTLLSNLDIIEEDRLSTKGPTNKQARSNRQDLFLDFYIFCSKKSTN